MTISPQSFKQFTIGFYNLENLFDYTQDKNILDKDFTALGRNEWNQTRYEKKLKNISDAISKIGTDFTGHLPAVLGIAEVENKKVLNDLINQPKLILHGYKYVHFNSPDERGIDVALLYRESVFKILESRPIELLIDDSHGNRDTTRDILYVKGLLDGTTIHIYVNHWPSRRDGSGGTEYKRMRAAQQLINHIDVIDSGYERVKRKEQDNKLIFIMGDFNDDPENDSIAKGLLPYGFKNITAPLKNFHRGSLNYRSKWNLFDQIMVSENLDNDVPNELYVYKTEIFDDIMLRQWKGRYRGQPSRTFAGGRYAGGYSDHFPVYTVLRRN